MPLSHSGSQAGLHRHPQRPLPRGWHPRRASYEEYSLDSQCHEDILPYDSPCLSQCGEVQRPSGGIVKNDSICKFHRDLRTKTSHGYAGFEVTRTGPSFMPFLHRGFFQSHLAYFHQCFNFVLGQESGAISIQAQFIRYQAATFTVSRKHIDLFDPSCAASLSLFLNPF